MNTIIPETIRFLSQGDLSTLIHSRNASVTL